MLVKNERSPVMFPILHPYGHVAFQAQRADVHTVLVDGRVVKHEGRLVGIDLGRETPAEVLADPPLSDERVPLARLGRVRRTLPTARGTALVAPTRPGTIAGLSMSKPSSAVARARSRRPLSTGAR